jgi:2-phosphosulfolactate phosphatase
MFDQSGFEVCCEWGEQGVTQLASTSDVVIIVDVLSFSTSVDIATSRGATVFPYARRDETAAEFAASVKAELACARHNSSGYSLSPQSLVNIRDGTRLVMPSPNGSTLSLHTGTTTTLAGCLRNCRSVAAAAQKFGRRIAVIPAGERWKSDGSLRPSFEDWVGAGAIISYLTGSWSPEARAAVAVFQSAQANLKHLLEQCSSGRELIQRGNACDVALASELGVSACVPVFKEGAYVHAEM